MASPAVIGLSTGATLNETVTTCCVPSGNVTSVDNATASPSWPAATWLSLTTNAALFGTPPASAAPVNCSRAGSNWRLKPRAFSSPLATNSTGTATPAPEAPGTLTTATSAGGLLTVRTASALVVEPNRFVTTTE